MVLQYVFVYTIVLLFFTFCAVLLIKYVKLCKIINRIPGPPPRFLIGNLLDIMGTPEQIFNKIRKLNCKYKILRMWLSYFPVVLINLPEDIEVVISTTNNLSKSTAYNPVYPWLKEGLITSTGQKWHARRKMLTPAFHFNILQQFIPIFFHQAHVSIEELAGLKAEEGFDAVPHLIDFTLRVICESTMGINFDLNKKAQEEYKEAIQEVGEQLVYRSMYPWLLFEPLFYLTPSYSKQKQLIKVLNNVSETVLKRRNKSFTQNTFNTEESESVQATRKKKLAMLDLLLSLKENGGVIDDEGIKEEVNTFIFAGHETTSITLSFTLMLLAKHREIQDRVYQEIQEVLGSTTDAPTYQELQSLPYLEMCIKETLRLYPAVPFIARIISQDVVTATGYKIPKYTQVGMSIFDMHHNPRIYPDPEKFDPERFLPDSAASRHPFAYLPFSGGPRNCIGQKFAMLEMKTFIASLLRDYFLEPVDTPESLVLTQDMVLRSKNGIRIKITSRSSQ